MNWACPASSTIMSEMDTQHPTRTWRWALYLSQSSLFESELKCQDYFELKKENKNDWHNDNKPHHVEPYYSVKLLKYEIHRIPPLHILMRALYPRQPSCAGRRGPGRSHQTGRKEQDHTSGWQISGPEPPEISDLQTAAASLSSLPAYLWTTPTQDRGGRVLDPRHKHCYFHFMVSICASW